MKEHINIGNFPNDKTGDPLRTAMIKANSNSSLFNYFKVVYSKPSFVLKNIIC